MISNNIPNEEDTNINNNPLIKVRQIICQICKSKESIYRCPRCQIRTCCLICVKQHKKKYKCTGVRDKFSKKPIKDFTENDYFRDMNFLNATINETNLIEKKCFDLTEENKTELITVMEFKSIGLFK